MLSLWIGYGNAQSNSPIDTTAIRYVSIDNIFVIGNKRTKESIILRELIVKKGMQINYNDLLKHMASDQKNIYNTRLFNTVTINALDLSKSQVDVVVQVDERWYTYPFPIFKIADRNFNDWLGNQGGDLSRVNYGGKFSQYNMRGRNEKLSISAQFGFTKNYSLSYRIPYIDRSQKNGLEFKVGYGERKSIAYSTIDHKLIFNASENIQFKEIFSLITYTRRSLFYDFHRVVLEFNKSTISDSLLLLNSRYFSNGQNEQQYIALKYAYTKDKRDVAAYPLNGYRIQGEISKIGLGLFNEIDILDIRLTYDRYFAIGKKFYLSIYSRGVASSPNNQSYRLFPSLGRQRDFIRGYELYLIEGSRYALNKMSFKKELLKGVRPMNMFGVKQFKTFPYALYLKTYFDVGYVNNFNEYEQSDRFTNKAIYGSGIGLDFVTLYDLVIRTEYSINDAKEHGFYFHFSKGF